MSAPSRPSKHTVLHAIRTNPPEAVHQVFGVSRDQFTRWCRDLGIEAPKIQHRGGCGKGSQFGGRKTARPDFETWRRLLLEHSRDELAERFRVSHWTIWNWCKFHGVPMPSPRVRPPDDAGPAPEEPPEPPRAAPAAADDDMPRLAPELPVAERIRLSYWCQGGIRPGSL